MPLIASLPQATSFAVATASFVNTNYATIKDTVNSYCLFKDVAATVTAIQTHSVTPVFNAGITVVGNTTITGTLSGVTTMTVTTLTATTLTGTLSTGAQPNITSLGTITSLGFGTTGKMVGGATTLSWRNNADSFDVIKYTESGAVLAVGSTSVVTNITGSAVSLVAAGGANVTVASSSLATNATTGFLCISGCGGVPTGAAPQGALVWDTSANKMYFRNASTWSILN